MAAASKKKLAFKKNPSSKRSRKEVHRKEMSLLNTEKEFSAAEAYKQLRTNITFSMSQREHRRILFTSSVPLEGKTSSICNFALVLSQAGYKVLLIDADMRLSRVHKYFGVMKEKTGLSTVLSTGETEGAVIRSDYPNLWLMFAGITPPNPAELLEGKYAEVFFDEIEKDFDYILVDTPPVNMMTDALILKKYDFSMVLVVREDFSDHRDIQKAIKAIRLVGGDLIGSVLIGSKNTLITKKKDGYGYGYGYGYYGYGQNRSQS